MPNTGKRGSSEAITASTATVEETVEAAVEAVALQPSPELAEFIAKTVKDTFQSLADNLAEQMKVDEDVDDPEVEEEPEEDPEEDPEEEPVTAALKKDRQRTVVKKGSKDYTVNWKGPRQKQRRQTKVASILAAAFQVSQPKRDWFRNQNLTGPTPLTVTDEGQVFGHIATWGTCHIGMQGECVQPPKSKSGYAFFQTGTMKVEGEDVPVGQITLGTGHANLKANGIEAAAHYDNTGTAVADVVAGEDEFGPWVAGAIRKGSSLEQVHALRAAAPSGDWRTISGNFELVGVLAVNVPGFPVARTSLAASAFGYDDDGKLSAVIATGKQGTDPEVMALVASLQQEVAAQSKLFKLLRPMAVALLKDQLPGSDKE